jgi:hypothetical protein
LCLVALFSDIVDLMLGVAGNEQQSSRVDVMEHIVDGDRSAP